MGDGGNPLKAVHGLPVGAGEARARDDLRQAMAKRDLLTADLAAVTKAVTAADQRRWDKQREISAIEEAEKSVQRDALAEEADLVAAVMEDRPMPTAAPRPNAEVLERLKREAESLQGAAAKLRAGLPERAATRSA